MDHIIKQTKTDTQGFTVGMKQLRPVKIGESAFADDLVIMTNTEKSLQKNIDIWNKTVKLNEMKINANKTKIMVIAKNQERLNIRINKSIIDQITHI